MPQGLLFTLIFLFLMIITKSNNNHLNVAYVKEQLGYNNPITIYIISSTQIDKNRKNFEFKLR
jgi:hypothetical protein